MQMYESGGQMVADRSRQLPTYAGFFSRHGLAVIVYAVLAMIFLWDALLQDKSLSGFDYILQRQGWDMEYPLGAYETNEYGLLDSPTAHYPQREFDWGLLKQGYAPGLNPYTFSGSPWISEGVGATVTAWPQFFLDTPDAIDWTLWFRLLLAGSIMYLAMVTFGCSRLPAFLAGLAWAYNLHQIVWLQFPQHIGTQLWIPALFALNYTLLKKGLDLRRGALLLLVIVLFATAGYTQIVLYSFLAAGAFNTLLVLLDNEQKPGDRIGNWLKLHSVYLASLLIWGLYTYAHAELLAEGLRGAQEWRGAQDSADLSLMALLKNFWAMVPPFEEVRRLFLPDFYGGIYTEQFDNPFSNNIEYLAYPGMLTLLLAGYSLFGFKHSARRPLLMAILITFGLVIAAMYSSPFMIGLMKLIPFAGSGNYSRFMTLDLMLICILAGLGLQCLITDFNSKTVVPRLLLVSVLLLLVPILGNMAGEEFAAENLLRPLALIFIALGVCAMWQWRGWSPKTLAVALIIVLIADLLPISFGFNSRVDNEYNFRSNSVIRFLQRDPDVFRVAVSSADNEFHPNMLSYYDIPVIGGYSTVAPTPYIEYIRENIPDTGFSLNGIMSLRAPKPEQLLDLNVKYLVSHAERTESGFEYLFSANNHHVYRLAGWQRRAVCIESDECSLVSEKALVGGYRVVVQADSPQVLRLTYPWHKHWQAKVNGQPVQLKKLDGIFLGLDIPAGKSEVSLNYVNPLPIWNAWVLLAFSACLLVLAARQPKQALSGVFILCSAIIMYKSIVQVSAVANADIAERTAFESEEPVYILVQGELGYVYDHPAEALQAGQEARFTINIDAKRFSRLRALAATFSRPHMNNPVRVRAYTSEGLLNEWIIDGSQIHDIQWITLDFDEEITTVEQLTLSFEVLDEIGEPFTLWLNQDDSLVFQAFRDYR